VCRLWFSSGCHDVRCLHLHVGTLTVGLRRSHGIAGIDCRVRLFALPFRLERKDCFSLQHMDSLSAQSWRQNAKRLSHELSKSLWSYRCCIRQLAGSGVLEAFLNTQ